MRQEFQASATTEAVVQFTIFVPSTKTDEAGNSFPIDQEFWREETLRKLGVLFRGGTALPRGRGVWRPRDKTELLFDDTVIVFSYAPLDTLTSENLNSLIDFIFRFKHEAGQMEVGMVFSDPTGSEYYGF